MKAVLPPFQRGGGFGTLGSSFLEPTLPEPISFAPATWGAWLTLWLLGVGLVLGVTALWRHWAGRQHRRMARRELAALREAWQRAPQAARGPVLEKLPPLLKGCALGSFDRARVAPLAGRSWLDFLRSTGPAAGFDGASGEALLRLCERGATAVDDAAVPALFSATERWIARHRA
ncbi:MAG TPA: DUF4381 domain-containing protein [Polyangiales bacterium]|nr:DUF4381 domain-containing protein [Polyangiales bacterium]